MKSAFDFNDYREFLKSTLPVSGESRGMRNRLAEALNCQKGFISQVLGGRSHFSLEHGTQISRFLELPPDEEEYFILLLHIGRAGSKDLEKFYQRRISEIQSNRRQIKERIRSKSDLTEAEQMTYYSSWHYIAVHMCLMIPEFRTRAAICKALGLPQPIVTKVLDFLISVGFAKTDGDEIVVGPARSHLPSSSPFISKHHTNWRMRAIDSLDAPQERDLHYSLVMSISDEAAEQIREALLKAIQNVEPIMKEAKDQTLYTLNLDLFSLAK